MIQIKIFYGYAEKEANKWLEEHRDLKIVDVKYSGASYELDGVMRASHQILIIYEVD